MVSFLIDRFIDPRFVLSLVFMMAAAITVLTMALPYLQNDGLKRRMKAVSLERDQIRARERSAMTGSPSLRSEPKAYMREVVERFSLEKRLGVADARLKLVQAGYRGKGAEVALLFYKGVGPVAGLVLGLVYFRDAGRARPGPDGQCRPDCRLRLPGPEAAGDPSQQPDPEAPDVDAPAFPDSLDLLLICVEAGMSIEAAFRRVSVEIGAQSIALAEEFTLTTAELSYLQERRQAYENLAKRTNLEAVKSVTTALVQAERYGTPLGTALRVLAQESRDMRMTEAEKKAMALPPKLTVPMIVFFLPVLMLVIMMPAVISAMGWS